MTVNFVTPATFPRNMLVPRSYRYQRKMKRIMTVRDGHPRPGCVADMTLDWNQLLHSFENHGGILRLAPKSEKSTRLSRVLTS